MKKFIFKTILFLLFTIIIDSLFGILCEKLANSSKGGDTAKYHYIAEECNDEILIMGSSRCSHHYIPSMFLDSLNSSCYNCGIDGNGIITMYGLLNVILEYNTPDIIVYDITHSFDLQKNDNIKYLGKLKRFYNNKEIKTIFEKIDKKETYKMFSSMYQYNSTLLQLIADNISPQQDNNNGYKALHGCIDSQPKYNDVKTIKYDPQKLDFIEQFILKCNGKTQLIFTISPYYFPPYDDIYEPVRKLCHKHNIPLLEHHNNTLFVKQKKYFKDSVHLNHEGAELYTRIIIQQIFDLLSAKYTDKLWQARLLPTTNVHIE